LSPLRLKLCGLNGIDKNALRSMLRLSSELLTANWLIVEQGNADLEIYSFDTEAGQAAWREREAGVMTALLTNNSGITEPVDIVFKKPLHKSSFSETLNLVEEKLRHQHNLATDNLDTGAGSEKTSWFRDFIKQLNWRRKPASHLPALDLTAPPATAITTDTIKDPALLQTWLSQLPRDSNQRSATLLKNIEPLCQLKLKPVVLMPLLEAYRVAIHALLFSRDLTAVRRDLYQSSENQRAIRNITQLLSKLRMGYQQISAHYYERGQTPERNKLMLVSLNRSAEQTALMVLQAYHYYQKPPPGCWQHLHQLYLYQEKAGTLQEQAQSQAGAASRSFLDLYVQIMLTALADPYSLARFEVFRLFRLLEPFTDKVEIEPLSMRQIETTSHFLMTGHFCIDTRSDEPPKAMVKTVVATRQLATSRLLNTQPALRFAEQLFNDAKRLSQASLDTELRLLKQIIPQLNTTLERRFHRLNSANHREIQIINGISAIHRALSDREYMGLGWKLVNQGSGGIMATRPSEASPTLNIGDFVGLFEQNFPVKLASIRWLYIDPEGDTCIGLELIDGKPVPIFCTPDGEAAQHAALIIPAESQRDTDAIITEKGLYSPRRRLRVKGDAEPYMIMASGMIDSTQDFELFHFVGC
jgi:hypothetical protein